ncbi:MAG: alcohol dehydrogenase catalytic domain-containing protein, partial [Anaerolineales bacterium]
MRAIICTKYGPPEVLKLQEIPKPDPKENEVLIKVIATSVHRGDTRMRGLEVPGPRWQALLARLVLGINKPRRAILGMELAGVIEAVGSDVTRFRVGDEIFSVSPYMQQGNP